jgi:ribonuclease HII
VPPRARGKVGIRRGRAPVQDEKYTSIRCVSSYEKAAREQGFLSVAGVDEVGRGCLFGPVFAAAVILDPQRPIRGLRDSKVLDHEARVELCSFIKARSIAWAVGGADAFEIDQLNIYQASRLAMCRAVEALSVRPDYLLIDAVRLDLPVAQLALIDGDARCRAIAAASIVAKVHRDECLRRWHEVFPQYNLASNKGYSTPDHRRALREFGPTFLHRFSFAPVRESTTENHWGGYLHPASQPANLVEEPGHPLAQEKMESRPVE